MIGHTNKQREITTLYIYRYYSTLKLLCSTHTSDNQNTMGWIIMFQFSLYSGCLKDVRYFPKAFSRAATSKGYFPYWQLPKCAISQAATLPRLAQPQRSAPIAACGASDRMPSLSFGKLHIWEVATWEVVHEKMPLGKYLSPSETMFTF